MSAWLRSSALVVALALPVIVSACAASPGSAPSPGGEQTPSDSPAPSSAAASPAASAGAGGSGGPGGSGGGAAPALTALVLSRSGGLTGLMQELSLAADGSWSYTDERTGRTERGRLTVAQRTQLARLTADPGLAQEARLAPPPGECADAFVYVLRVGELSIRYEQCGGPSGRPITEELLNLLVDYTPM